MFWKTYNTEFDGITRTLTDQNGRSLQTAGRANLTCVLIHRNDTLH